MLHTRLLSHKVNVVVVVGASVEGATVEVSEGATEVGINEGATVVGAVVIATLGDAE